MTSCISTHTLPHRFSQPATPFLFDADECPGGWSTLIAWPHPHITLWFVCVPHLMLHAGVMRTWVYRFLLG